MMVVRTIDGAHPDLLVNRVYVKKTLLLLLLVKAVNIVFLVNIVIKLPLLIRNVLIILRMGLLVLLVEDVGF
jgi:hypothetical protein